MLANNCILLYVCGIVAVFCCACLVLCSRINCYVVQCCTLVADDRLKCLKALKFQCFASLDYLTMYQYVNTCFVSGWRGIVVFFGRYDVCIGALIGRYG